MVRPIVAAKARNADTGKEEKIYCLIDSGANRDYVSTDLAERLGLEKHYGVMVLKTATDVSRGVRPMVSMVLESINNSYSVMIGDVLVGDFPSNEGSQAPSKQDWSKYPHLQDLEFIDLDSKVEMIISSGHAEATTSWEKPRRGKRGEPVGRITEFGWTVEGRDGMKAEKSAYVSALSADDRELKENMRLIFERDFPVVQEDEKSLSREAKYALEQLEESVKWNEAKGKYSAGLPYKLGRDKTAEIYRKFLNSL